MKKKEFVLVICLAVFTFLILGFILLFQNKNNDALKFKEEYESLNGTVRESDGAIYNSIEIDSDNPIKYIDCNDALEVLKSNKAIIYVGASWCPWCRNAIPILLEVAKNYKVNTIYYLNLDDEKSTYEIKDDELVKTSDGSKAYYKLLDKLSDKLDNYMLTDEDGIIYDTLEKRIYMPYVIAVRDKKIVRDHVGTVDLENNQTKYSSLTDEQHDMLYNIYDEMFFSVYRTNTCTSDELCN